MTNLVPGFETLSMGAFSAEPPVRTYLKSYSDNRLVFALLLPLGAQLFLKMLMGSGKIILNL